MSQPSSSPRIRPTLMCAAALALIAAGCEQERNVVTSARRPKSRAADIVGVDTGEASNPAPAAAPRPNPPANQGHGSIVGRRTQDIRNAQTEIQSGQAKQVTPRIVAKDPFTLAGNAYVTAIGQTSINNIKHAMDLYQATNGRYPKDYDEFMSEIIRANNIALPVLPPYQEYGYDADAHKLIIMEYPDRR